MSLTFSKKEIQELEELIYGEYKVKFSNEDLLDFATHIFKMVRHAYSPLNKAEFESIKEQINNTK
jgi:hypothetical protein